MHTSFTSHNPDFSLSSKGVMDYLEKENAQRSKFFEETVDAVDELLKNGFDEQL